MAPPALRTSPHHVENHFRANDVVRDIVMGMSDGLTVPFALAAGLTGAVALSRIIVTAGLAEIAAGCISMGLGGYLAARSEIEHYGAERAREEREVNEMPDLERQEVVEIFEQYGLDAQESRTVAAALSQRRKPWIDFMMRFELGLEEPEPRRALESALTIGGSYAVGGLIPLAPYFFISASRQALSVSIALTGAALLIFGFVKGRFTGSRPVRGALQTLVIGALAAGAAFLLAKAVS